MALPSQIGPYRLLGPLGFGGMGTVYEAVHEQIERRVAVKILKAELASDLEVIRRFFNEARAVNRIDHPGVVQIFDLGQTPDGHLYLIMELLVGDSLSTILRRLGTSRLSAELSLRYSWQIAETLACAHDKGIIHRDIKPDNIMIVSDHLVAGGQRVKVLDFGIAKLQQASIQMTELNRIIGTAAYMSPEQCRGLSDIDGRTDVYSLGVLTYQLFAGKLPFGAFSLEAAIAQHLFADPPLLQAVDAATPDGLVPLVHSMLHKDRELRPTMREVERELHALLQEVQERTAVGSPVFVSSGAAAVQRSAEPAQGPASAPVAPPPSEPADSAFHGSLDCHASEHPALDPAELVPTSLSGPPVPQTHDSLSSLGTNPLTAVAALPRDTPAWQQAAKGALVGVVVVCAGLAIRWCFVGYQRWLHPLAPVVVAPPQAPPPSDRRTPPALVPAAKSPQSPATEVNVRVDPSPAVGSAHQAPPHRPSPSNAPTRRPPPPPPPPPPSRQPLRTSRPGRRCLSPCLPRRTSPARLASPLCSQASKVDPPRPRPALHRPRPRNKQSGIPMTFKTVMIAAALFACFWLSAAGAIEAHKITDCEQVPQCAESFAAAQNAAKSGDSARALQMFLSHLEKYDDRWALYPIAVMYQRLSDFRQAAAYFRRFLDAGIEQNPARIEAVKSQLDDVVKRQDAPRDEPHLVAAAPAPAPAKRPRWRTGLGASLLASGAVAAAFGIWALALSGTCRPIMMPETDPLFRPYSVDCYNTAGIGAGLATLGGGALAGGLITLFLPTSQKPQEKKP